MKKVENSPDDYLVSLPESVRADMAKLDKEISKIMVGEERVLWSGTFWGGSEQNIIGYGELVYERPKGNIEWFKVGLALQKNYISLYISAVDVGGYVAEKYGKDLGKVKVGKSSISFKSLEDIDLYKLIELLQKAKNLTS